MSFSSKIQKHPIIKSDTASDTDTASVTANKFIYPDTKVKLHSLRYTEFDRMTE
jgi:hypothetical protein